MRKILLLAKREYIASVKSKGFIIGLILAPIFMSGSVIAIFLLQDRVNTDDRHVYIIDRSKQLSEFLILASEERNKTEVFDEETGDKVRPAYIFDIYNSDVEDLQEVRFHLSEKIRNNELHGFLEIGAGVIHPSDFPEDMAISYYARNSSMDEVRNWISWPLNNQLRKLRLRDAGIEESQVTDLFSWINIDGLGLVSVDEETGELQEAERANELEALLVPIGIMMLMFLMLMMSVPGMLQSVMEEKTQRIAEVLLGTVKPFQFMAGKLIGAIAVSLTSSAVYIIGGMLTLNTTGYADKFPYEILPWFIIFLLLAIVMNGSIATALGSTCSEAKDAQSLTFPAMLPMIIPMFVYFPVLKEPLSNFATVISLIPPLTPMLMVLRMASPEGIPSWQPVVGLIGVFLFSILFVWIGGRIFRVALLIQGTPPKFSNILKWIFKG